MEGQHENTVMDRDSVHDQTSTGPDVAVASAGSIDPVQAQRVRLFYEQIPFAVLGNLASGGAYIALLWPGVSHLHLSVWYGAFVFSLLVRAAIWLDFRWNNRPADVRALRLSCTMGTVSGVFWGVGTLLTIHTPDPIYPIIANMIVAGALGASMATLGVYAHCFARFMLLAMGPITVWFLFSGERMFVLTATLSIIYMSTAFITSRRYSRTLWRSVELAIEKDHLARQVQERNQAITEFFARMSHEIRTPLNGILGMAHILQRNARDATERRFLGSIASSGKALLAVINEILDYSRMGAGKLTLVHDDFSLVDLVEDATRIFTASAEEKRIKLVVGIDADVPVALRGDAQRLRRVLVNLIGNAIKFTDTGSVVLRISRRSDVSPYVRLQFDVRDTGPGIPADVQSELFDPYVQANFTGRGGPVGSGLGLSIAKQLVELMEGELGLESTVGKGSRFWFTARLAQAAELQPTADVAPDLGSYRVLLVEADANARATLGRQLQQWGLAVTHSAGHVADEEPRNSVRGYSLLIAGNRDAYPAGASARSGSEGAGVDDATPNLAVWALSGGAVEPGAEPLWVETPLTPAKLRAGVERALGLREPAEETAPGEPPRFEGVHVLVAEDDTINQTVISEMLAQIGCSPEICSDGQEAVVAAESRDFDLILLDCEMPRMDGFEAAQTIRRVEGELGRTPVPIIAVTGYSPDTIEERMGDCGMDHCITKPIDIDDLRAVIGQWAQGRSGVAPDSSHSGASVVEADDVTRADDNAPLDEQRIDQMRTLLGPGFAELVAVFATQTGDLIDAMGMALAEGDRGRLRKLIHTWEGACRSIGARRMWRLAARLRARLNEEPDEGADEALLALLREERALFLSRANDDGVASNKGQDG
ncbi:MAG: ATP-binding protein [Gammaproteobacteria bacterium]